MSDYNYEGVAKAYDACTPACGPDTVEADNKAFSININPLDFGYQITVGCQNFAIEKVEDVTAMLDAYLRDPKRVEKEWKENKVLPNK